MQSRPAKYHLSVYGGPEALLSRTVLFRNPCQSMGYNILRDKVVQA
jgi:hypothetical protein